VSFPLPETSNAGGTRKNLPGGEKKAIFSFHEYKGKTPKKTEKILKTSVLG
jgi:hypothetical protein